MLLILRNVGGVLLVVDIVEGLSVGGVGRGWSIVGLEQGSLNGDDGCLIER